MRVAYADPPYPGLARYYAGHRDFAGEVDHADLLSCLQQFDGWALSTSSVALGSVLSLCVAQGLPVRVAAWVRGGRGSNAKAARRSWEPVIYRACRHVTDVDDSLSFVARPRLSDVDRVIGAKPAAFCSWMFQLIGARAGDSFTDLFPGSGGVGRAWTLYAGPRATDAADPEAAAFRVDERILAM